MLHYASEGAAPEASGRAITSAVFDAGELKSHPDIRLVTRHLPAREQFDAWCDHVGPVMEVASDADARRSFDAELDVWDLGELLLVRSLQPGISFRRSERRCRSDGMDHLVLTATRGPEFGWRGPGAATSGGALMLHFLNKPFEGQAAGGEAVHLCVPRDFLRQACPAFGTPRSTIETSAFGRMLASFLVDLGNRMPELDPTDYPGLLGTIRAMVAANFRPAAEGGGRTHPVLQASVIERARRLVQQHLHSPSLNVDSLCRELGVSRSRLYRLFEPMGGVVHYIRHRRLLDAHMALANGNDRRPIVDIAAERGFIDPAEFSRAFKREFGYRPSDARGGADLQPARRPGQAADHGTSLAALMQALR